MAICPMQPEERMILKRYLYAHGFILFFLLQQLAAQSLPVQSNGADKLNQVVALRNRGEYQQALDVLAPLVHSSGLSASDAGHAWVLLGSTYQDLGKYTEAQRAYQNGISILKAQAGGERGEAAALDDLGSLYRDMGQPEMSKKLRLKVLQFFLAIGDHSGTARAYNNLTAIALQQNKLDEARKDIVRAFDELKLAQQAGSQVSLDDQAAIDNNAGWLSFHD